jgi:hypothetical protein
MKFCKSISIVTQSDAPLHISPLSYLVQADGEHTKEYENGIKSAQQWAVGWGNQGLKPTKVYTFQNIPTSGFKLGTVATRYSTSNKFYRIIDPRGFQLEISTANLLDIIQTGEIAYGEIIGEYVWVKSTRDYLCSVNHPEYKRWLNPPAKEKTKTLDINDLVILPNDGEALYIGKKYMLEGCIKGTTNPDWRHVYGNGPNLMPYYLYDVSVKHPEKPVHVFLTAYGVATRSRLENFKLISQSESKYFNEIIKRKEEYTTPYNENYRSFFETREELLANKDAFLKQFHTEMVKRYGADAVRGIAV